MKILGLIPARGGSKGIPGKNIKLLNGKPLIAYTIECASKAKSISRLVLSSDSEDIIKTAHEYGLEAPFKRPDELAQDNTPTLAVVQHALNYFKERKEYFDAVCLLQPTSPFKTSDFIDEAIDKFISSGADALVSVQKVPDEYNPHWVFKTNIDGRLELVLSDTEIISRRQELPNCYHRDGHIYITKTAVLVEQNSLYGNSLAYIESPKAFSINIDTPEDWQKANEFLNRITK